MEITRIEGAEVFELDAQPALDVLEKMLGFQLGTANKHLPKYLGEFEFRFNLRQTPELMFEFLICAFARPNPAPRRAP